jgi:hypothetical protein
MSLPALYELAAEYRCIAEKLADMDLDAQTVADTLESLSGDLEIKAQNVAMFALSLDATADAIKAHREHQKQREDAIRKRAEALRDYLARCMTGCGIEKIEGPGIVLSFRKSSAVVIDEPGLVPAEFMRRPEPPPPAPDKTAIAAAIKAGREVPGAYVEQRKSLQVRG